MTPEQGRLSAEVNRLLHEQIKIQNESIHYAKRNKYFDISIVLAIVAGTVAITKLFL